LTSGKLEGDGYVNDRHDVNLGLDTPPPPATVGMGVLDEAEYAKARQVLPEFLFWPELGRQLVLIFGGWASVTLEVFSRHRFGERYVTPFRLALGTLIYGAYIALFGGIEIITYFSILQDRPSLTALERLRLLPGNTIVLVLFLGLFLLVGALHSFDIFYRNTYTEELCHSKSFGVPWGARWFLGRRILDLPPLDEWFVLAYVEPWVWFLLGGALMWASQVFPFIYLLGQWFLLASLALFAKNQILKLQAHERDLDLMDAKIVVAARRLSAQGAPSTETGGYKVMTLPRGLDRNQEGQADALSTEDIMRRFLKSRSGAAAPAVDPAMKGDEQR
jgi:hypothetical protein